MITFNEVDFSECRSEEVKSFFWRLAQCSSHKLTDSVSILGANAM